MTHHKVSVLPGSQGKMKGNPCRLWWPKQLSSCKPSSDLLLFGWCMHSAFGSLDFVVATGASPSELLLQFDLEKILKLVNKRMPLSLQNRTKFSVLGHFAVGCSNLQSSAMDGQRNVFSSEDVKDNLLRVEPEEGIMSKNSDYDGELFEKTELSHCTVQNCDCHKLGRFLKKYRHSLVENGYWIQLNLIFKEFSCEKRKWIPKLHQVLLNGQIVTISHAHIITYEVPCYGVHHFSMSNWSSLNQAAVSFKKPLWLSELDQRPPRYDFDTVVSALNCAKGAKSFLSPHLGSKRSSSKPSVMTMLAMITWHLVAILTASVGSLLYLFLQFCHRLLSHVSKTSLYMILIRLYSQAWNNVHVRSCQLLYWPLVLGGSGSRFPACSFLSNVDYAHRTALRKHAVWSSIAIDILLGNIVGLALLVHADEVNLWISHVACSFTDNLLRSGCVWLMGVPAGFKLNTQLAKLLGLVSLNAIQIWSTLWFYTGCAFRYFLLGLAVSGMSFGMTTLSALCIDMLRFASLHVMILHTLISFIYSRQIWALTSLWRLFRGQKWNPLRLRLDSYDYTVEQHVVGSLLFTPILLLLPTTCVFYIFFTMVTSAVSFICVMIEVAISIHHATPYAEIFLRMARKRRFPSGLWFKSTCHLNLGSGEESEVSSSDIIHKDCNGYKGQILVSLLQSNYASIGQILGLHYTHLFPPLSVVSSVSGVLSGQRIPLVLGMRLPATMPWMNIAVGEYWSLCYDSVRSCASDKT